MTDEPTPRLVAVYDDIAANIDRMAAYAREHKKALRPHAKTHKSPDIARLQVQAGAIGVSCATVSEIEAMAAAGLKGLLLTSPIAPEKTKRIAALHATGHEVMAVADTPWLVDAYARANAGNKPLPLLVDMDIGHKRTGTQSPAASVAVARHIAAQPDLVFAGVQAYAGHAQHIVGTAQRLQTSEACAAKLREHLKALKDAGLTPKIVTGSGTGCFAEDMAIGLYTEFQVGSYVVMDTEYSELERGQGPAFAPALFVEATVICDQFDGFVLVDAGHKALFRAGPIPVVAGEKGTRLRYEYAGDEHGRLYGAAADLPKGGERVRFILPHCDPNVVLHDHIDVERGGEMVARWPVAARGAW